MMVTLEEARRVIEAAEGKASEMGRPMNIAVVDEGGNLVSHNHARVMVFAGGIPLTRGGKVVGGVGVNGGSGEQDHAVADAGAKAF
jgi:uncharacterized protein GlcG (DUF336 family)